MSDILPLRSVYTLAEFIAAGNSVVQYVLPTESEIIDFGARVGVREPKVADARGVIILALPHLRRIIEHDRELEKLREENARITAELNHAKDINEQAGALLDRLIELGRRIGS